MTQIIRQQRIETTMTKSIFLYGQWYGDRDSFSFGGDSYNYILTREPIPKYLGTFNTGLANEDFISSANITSTTKTEVIADTDFILFDTLLSPLIIQGYLEAEVYLTVRGDSVYSTYLDSVRFTLLKKVSGGTETQITQEEYPKTSLQPLISNLYNYSTPRLKVNFYKDVSETEIAVDEKLVLRLEVFGHSENALSSHNIISMLFNKGTSDLTLKLPVIQDG
jgi:hypothetical protein